MARKPNYDFERKERERAKAAKALERTKAKAEKAERPTSEADQAAGIAEHPGTSDKAD